MADLLSKRENFLCSAIRAWKAKEQKLAQERYEFRNRLSVGDFSSISCCPRKLIENKQTGKRFNVGTTYKLDLGKAIHTAYQDAVLNTPNLQWIKPYNFPSDIMIISPDKPPVSFGQKLKEGFPELPVCLLDENGEIAVIGYTDGVINRYKKPVCNDFKTVNIPEKDFLAKFDDHYPDPKHILQVKIYIYLMRLWGYFEAPGVKPMDTGLLTYICTRGESGSPDMEKEVEFPYTEIDEKMIGAMLAEGVRQVQAWKAGNKDLPCGYNGCKTHYLDNNPEEVNL